MLRALRYGHYITDITLQTLRYEYNNKLAEIKQTRVALHSG